MKLFGQSYTRRELEALLPDLAQVSGMRKYSLLDGRSAGVEVIEARAGSDFRFTVVPSRGFDISGLELGGIPIGYATGTGIVAPQYYQPDGDGWNWSFYGGLLVTCGLSQIGNACVMGDKSYGQHGRISNVPAEQVWMHSAWENDELCLSLGGRMREREPFGGNLVLERAIYATTSARSIRIRDRVENRAFAKCPFLILYHFNIGFPLAGLHARIVSNAQHIQDIRGSGTPYSGWIPAPSMQGGHSMHLHTGDMHSDSVRCAGVYNDRLQIGLLLRYRTEKLPFLLEFISQGAGDYFVALEPANCIYNRRDAEQNGGLPFLDAGQTWENEVELFAVNSTDQINKLLEGTTSILESEG